MVPLVVQLKALLDRRDVGRMRKTDENPPRISVNDEATLVTGKNASNAARDEGFVKERYPDVTQKLSDVKLPDARGPQRPVSSIFSSWPRKSPRKRLAGALFDFGSFQPRG